MIYEQLYITRGLCRIGDFHFQYPNWPIYPFYNLLKIMYNRDTRLFYPALTGSKIPPQNSAKAKNLGGRSTARKSPIGSTNNQWGMKTPH